MTISTDSALIFNAKHKKWRCFSNPSNIFSTSHRHEVLDNLERIHQCVETENKYAVGFLRYEAASAFDPSLQTLKSQLPLLWFGIYDHFDIVELPQSSEAPEPLDWEPVLNEKEYSKRIQTILEYLASGDTYQVNFTFPLSAQFEGKILPFFENLVKAHKPSYPALIITEDKIICSASPELFFHLEGNHLISKPMKGTIKRGLTLTEDVALAEKLRTSIKDQAENVMIVDMIRNDMGHIAESGSVKVDEKYTLEKYPHVWQMTSTVSCKTQATIPEIMKALFPCASITGAPKTRTMELIAELEETPRSVYTGTIGYWGPNRDAQFNVAIRTVEINKKTNQAVYGVGSGIVWDSTPALEYEECLQKAAILTETSPTFRLLETMLWTPEEGYFLLNYHLSRLGESAKYFEFPIDAKKIEQMLQTKSQTFQAVPQRVRLLMDIDGNWTIEQYHISTEQKDPVQLKLAPTSVYSSNRFLYHKTTHRDIYDKMRHSCTQCDDVILWNEKHEITETTIANIIIQWEDRYITPPVSSGLLAGTFRAHLLEQGEIHEQIITKEMLRQTTEIALINSVRKWQSAILLM